ncbi:MAG: hypothetical protein GY749_40995 [Desulfobacteraceae bacterium]|nr:hypothetical protein [Desulfobacteraceae bacterium]
MKKLFPLTAIVCFFAVSFLFSPVHADELDNLRQNLKDCNSESCRDAIQSEAEQISDAAGKQFKDDFFLMGNEISIRHCRSMVQETLYHMEKIKSYYNFKDVFHLTKLKKLKENRDRMKRGQLSSEDFSRVSRQVEAQYESDIRASQDFVDEKALRMKELCENLNQTAEYIRDNLRLRQERLSEALNTDVISLKSEPVWQAFESNSGDGRKIRDAILLAPGNTGKNVIDCMTGMFSRFGLPKAGYIFSPELIENIINRDQ